MNEKKGYLDRLSEEKYYKELNSRYINMMKNPESKRCLEDIDRELTLRSGTNSFLRVPDYSGFLQYAYKHYFPKNAENYAFPKYKELVGDLILAETPGFMYCIVLYGHLIYEMVMFEQAHQNDYKSLSREMRIRALEQYNKVKLLFRFLMDIEKLVAVVVNSIDLKETIYLDDDITTLDATAVKHRFMHALHSRNKSMSLKLLGRMRELDAGEDYYFEALAHYINEELDETLRYANKIEPSNIDYNSAITLKLECYSLLGDYRNFTKCIYDNRHLTYNFEHIVYLLLLLLVNPSFNQEEEDDDYTRIFSNDIKYDMTTDENYAGLLFRLIADILVEGLGILDESEYISESVEELVLPTKSVRRFMQLSKAVKILPDNISRYLNFDYIGNKDIAEIKKEAKKDLLNLLLNNNPNLTFEDITKAFLCQLHLGDVRGFLKNVSDNFDALVDYSNHGENSAEELIRIAYIEGTVAGELDERVRERVDTTGAEELSESIADKEINKFLSERGRLAYEAAEWNYVKSLEEDYGWKDAGMISLGFYRILELELNDKIIIPLLSTIGYDTMNTICLECANTFSGKTKKQYKSKWQQILRDYREMEENHFLNKGFMLGRLNSFFKVIGSEYVTEDALATKIRDNFESVFNSYGISMFEEGFFETITNDDARMKYRNPPAHSRYLPYNVACDSRQVVREAIIQMSKMLN